MTAAFDPRLVQVTLDLPNGPQMFQDLAIMAQGRIFASPIQNTCEAKIFNIKKETIDYIVTQASPLKTPRTPINMALDVGRQSYGIFRLFQGNVIAAEVTQPPDIGVVLRSLTSNFLTGAIQGVQQTPSASLFDIALNLAQRGSWILNFQAKDKQINNYTFTGSVNAEMKYLQAVGGINVFVSPDNTTLYVIDADKAIEGQPILINAANGMVGIPQVTDSGINVRVMINNAIKLGGSVTIESTLNPAANGTFKVVQILYDLANRDHPFWYNLYCSNLAYYQGTT